MRATFNAEKGLIAIDADNELEAAFLRWTSGSRWQSVYQNNQLRLFVDKRQYNPLLEEHVFLTAGQREYDPED